MSCDLDIHVLDGTTEEDYKMASSNCLFSKYFDPISTGNEAWDRHNEAVSRLRKTPRLCVGELDSGPNDFEDCISLLVVGEDFPVIDDELIRKVMSVYSEFHMGWRYGREKMRRFLKKHRGKKVITFVW